MLLRVHNNLDVISQVLQELAMNILKLKPFTTYVTRFEKTQLPHTLTILPEMDCLLNAQSYPTEYLAPK